MADYNELLENLLLQEGFGAIWQYNYEVREPGEEGVHADPTMANDHTREEELTARNILARKSQDFPSGSEMDGVHHPCASKKILTADVGMPTNSHMDGKHYGLHAKDVEGDGPQHSEMDGKHSEPAVKSKAKEESKEKEAEKDVDEQLGDLGGMAGTPLSKEESVAEAAKGKKKAADAKKTPPSSKKKASGPQAVTQTKQPGKEEQEDPSQQQDTQSAVQNMMIFRMQSDADAAEASQFFNSIGLATKTDGPILLVDPVQQPMNSMPFSTIQLRLPSPEDAKDAYERLNSLGVQGEVEGNQILVEPQTPEDSALVARVAKIYGLSLTGFRTDAAGSGGMMQQAPGQQQ
jgi:hypothetical protein